MINEIDQDGNGCISFNEFVYLMTKNVHEVSTVGRGVVDQKQMSNSLYGRKLLLSLVHPQIFVQTTRTRSP